MSVTHGGGLTEIVVSHIGLVLFSVFILSPQEAIPVPDFISRQIMLDLVRLVT